MFFHGEILIDYRDLKQAFMAPKGGLTGLVRKLFGVSPSSREVAAGAALLERLRAGLESAGYTNAVRCSVDDRVGFQDELGQADDASPLMESVASNPKTAAFSRMRLLLERRDDPLNTFVQLEVDRAAIYDHYPIRVGVFAAFAELHPDRLPGERGHASTRDRMQRVMAQWMTSPESLAARLRALDETFAKLLEDIDAHVCKQFELTTSRNVRRPCIVVQREALEEPSDVPPRSEPYGMPIFEAYPGFRETMFYTQLWGHMCAMHDTRADCTLFVDPAGRPALWIDTEPFSMQGYAGLEPGGEFRNNPVLHTTYFAGHDFEGELLTNLLSTVEGPIGGAHLRAAMRKGFSGNLDQARKPGEHSGLPVGIGVSASSGAPSMVTYLDGGSDIGWPGGL